MDIEAYHWPHTRRAWRRLKRAVQASGLLCRIVGHRWRPIQDGVIDRFFPLSIAVECDRCHCREIASTRLAERARILAGIDGLGCIKPGGVVSYPDGCVADLDECYGVLFDQIRDIVRG